MNARVLRQDEFDDLVELLFDHASQCSQEAHLLARMIAQACLGENHLWQDLGLPNRQVLNELMHDCFPSLHAKNIGNMRWKKFFYRQLCERADIPVCQSPSCGVCCDYAECFSDEDGYIGNQSRMSLGVLP
ncbi:nitrogen fixation protein NifQ [Gammaproteobacteria bacterium]